MSSDPDTVDTDTLELATEPANPELVDEARRVLAYLQWLPGEGWLVGQQENDDSVDAEQTYIESVTGKRPAIRGFDVAEYIVDPVEEAIDAWQDHGQIVALSWHICRPLTESDFDNVLDEFDEEERDAADEELTAAEEATEHFQKEGPAGGELPAELQVAREAELAGDYYDGQADVEAALTPGTDQHEWLLDRLEWMADRLEPLADEGVPVLWRPYHEMDGGWFWWSNAGPEGLVGLWEQMYDYFVDERELNNLIWVWSRSHEPKSGWYPGDEYVDVTGTDTYREAYNDLDWADHYQLVLDVTDEKPVALAECDEFPDPDDVPESYPFVWVLPWHTELIRYNDEAHIQSVYDHPYTVTAEDLPEF